MTSPSLEATVISLATAGPRRAAMSAQLDGWRIKWSFFDAHRGLENPALKLDEAAVRQHYGRTLTPGQLGCYSSHFTAWEQFLTGSTADYLLVLEDDLLIDPDFPYERFCATCGEMGVDYMRLFGRNAADRVVLRHFIDRSIIRFRTTPTGTQGYILSRKGAKGLIEACRRVDTAVDLAMDRFWTTGMPLYSVYPFPLFEKFSPTSIPLPHDFEPVSKAEKLAALKFRVREKLGKIMANRRLKASDKGFQSQDPGFEQVGG